MPFSSKRFLHRSTMPAVREGLQASGRQDFRIIPEVIVSGDSDEAVAGTRRLLSFYGSTPAYRPVLAAHGWEDLQPELNAMSKQGRWQEMGSLITDEMMHTIAACGTPAQIAAHIRDRIEGVSDTVFLYQAAPIGLSTLAEIIDRLGSDG
jgi:alkanesulfonate monooxygenase SsuD/methylene tetrahydromethanopterin reductase-like flavin-dependent oxidoreductase (luciferase family)